MKVRTLLVAAVMFFALSAAAFAQATFSVGSTPVTAVISNGLTERTGDITFAITSGTSADGTISVSYSGIPITSLPSTITVTGTGALAGATLNTTTTTSSLASGIVIINVPVGGVTGNVLTLKGVRVAVANTGLTSLNAQISSTVNAITAGQTVVQVIAAISPAITVSGESVTFNSVTGKTLDLPPVPTATAHMLATEVFLNAFGPAQDTTSYPAGDPAAPNVDAGALMVRFTLNTNPPEGMTLSFPMTAGSFTLVGADEVPLSAAQVIDSTTEAPLQVYYKISSGSDPTTIETLDVPVTVTGGASVVGAAKINFTATVAPIGTATVTAKSLIPRYTVSESAANDLVLFTGSSTTLLIPYSSVATAISYDTGIAIANTTEDPGKSAMGGTYAGATAQPGGFTIYFFPQSGANFSVASTAAAFATVGTGLDATGKIPAGGTFVALLSNMVKAAQTANPTATIPDDFTGYLIIVTNFTNAHGLATVSNFQTYTQAAPMLVVDGDRTAELGLKP